MSQQASFDDVIYRAAVSLLKQSVASRIDIYKEIVINGERVTVRVKITADWTGQKIAFPLEL